MGKIIVDGKIYAEKTDENTVTFEDPTFSAMTNVFWCSDTSSDNSKRIKEIGSLSFKHNKVMILRDGKPAALTLHQNTIIGTNSNGRVTIFGVEGLQ